MALRPPQPGRGAASIVYGAAVLLLLVATVLPVPSNCSSAVPREAASDSSTGAVSSGNVEQYNHHPRRRHQHHQHPQRTDHGTDESPDDAHSSPPKVLTGYADSYITKKAAQELQEKLRRMPQPVTDEQYNELLQKLVTKPKSDPAHPIYNKMYYDFVETQEQRSRDGQPESLDEAAIDLTERVKSMRKRPIKKAHSFVDEEQGERRAKRSVEAAEHQIEKRQTGVWTNQYQRQRQRYETRRTFNAPPPFVSVVADHDFDDYPTVDSYWTAAAAFAQPRDHAAYVSSWTNGLHRPQQPSNWYLPVAPPPGNTQFIVRPPPQQPWISQPIPGVVYNPAFPPKNPAPVVTGLRPGVISVHPTDTNSIGDGADIPNRFGNEAEEEDRFVFDVEDRTTTTRRPATQSPRFPTRRPPPPLIRDSDNAADTDATINSIFNTNTNNNNRPWERQPTRTTTRRPPPPLIRNTEDVSPPIQSGTSASNSAALPNRPPVINPTRAPPTPSRSTTRRTTTTTTTPAPQENGPSRCVWAIVNCCKPQDRRVRYSCFERLGCGGAFWDINPCNDDILNSALDYADKYAE